LVNRYADADACRKIFGTIGVIRRMVWFGDDKSWMAEKGTEMGFYKICKIWKQKETSGAFLFIPVNRAKF